MDVLTFTKLLNDKETLNLNKLQYKYPDDFKEYLSLIDKLYYKKITLKDFKEKKLIYNTYNCNFNLNTIKILSDSNNNNYNLDSLEQEIISTSNIENVNYQIESVHNIVNGQAPSTLHEQNIYGLKKAYEFITDSNNKINEDNIYKLYMLAIGNYLNDDNKLINDNKYRRDSVYIVSNKIEHIGIDYKKLPLYMNDLIQFIDNNKTINDLIKASIIHFYIAYLHPYFDGNGRMARLLHIWYLIQKGYRNTLCISISKLIENSKSQYYKAFKQCEQNYHILNQLDITPFIVYINNNVYNQLDDSMFYTNTLEKYKTYIQEKLITKKESELFSFVMNNYGNHSFTTKQLEKDYGHAAYATIYNFVLKFTKLQLLTSKPLSTKVLYQINK